MLAQLGLNAVDEVNAAILSCGDVGATCQTGRFNQLLVFNMSHGGASPREVEDSDVEDWDTLMLPQEVVLPPRTEPEEMVPQEVVLPPRQAPYASEGQQDRTGQPAEHRTPAKTE